MIRGALVLLQQYWNALDHDTVDLTIRCTLIKPNGQTHWQQAHLLAAYLNKRCP
jgi:hypothetical protein